VLKVIFIFIAVAFSSGISFAQTAPVFCAGSDIDMTPSSENCITTCKAVAGRAASYLSNNTSGYCVGQSSYSKFTIFGIALGRASSGTESLCKIWEGILPVVNSSNVAGGEVTGGPIDLSKCPPGSYDTVHIITSRFTEFSGNTVFPNASGTGGSPTMARTTATFSNSSSSYSPTSGWLEDSINHSNNAKPYVRPSNTWNTVYKKLAAAPSSANLSASTDVRMFYDELKGAKLNDGGSTTGWLCESVANCSRQDPNDENQIEMRLTSAVGVIAGLPLAITSKNNCTVDFAPNYYSFSRGSTNEMGVKFLWHNDGGTLKYLGAYPAETGLYINIGTPTCSNR